MSETKTHSKKQIILRTVLIVTAIFVVLAAVAGGKWVYDMYLAFNNPVLTGADPVEMNNVPLEEFDKLTDTDELTATQILDDKGIPYKEAWGTTIFVRSGDYKEASDALLHSGYEFDGYVWA